jgi:hypothetical protein
MRKVGCLKCESEFGTLPIQPSVIPGRALRANPESITTIGGYGFRACAQVGASRNDGCGNEATTPVPHTILIDMSGRPCSLQSSTSPFTTGPTFSGVPE